MNEQDRFQLAIDTATTEYYDANLRRERKESAVMSLGQVADRFDVSVRTIRRLVEQGELRGFQVGNRVWRFQESDVEEYIEYKREKARYHSPVDRVCAEAKKHPERIREMIEALLQLA